MQPDLARLLQLAVRAAPSADNSQPWSLRIEGQQIVIYYEAGRLHGALFSQSHPATLLALGCVIENLHQLANAAGLTLSPNGAVSMEAGIDVLRYDIAAGPSKDCQPATLKNLPLFQRHTNRLPFKTNRVAGSFQSDSGDGVERNVRVQRIDSKPDIAQLAAFIEKASQVRFQTREIHEWFSHSLRFSAAEVARGDGLDVDTLGLPPGGRTLLKTITTSWRNMSIFNRLGGYRFLAKTEAASITKAGAIFAIVGPRGLSGEIDAGRHMQRLWIDLNSAGYAVQPYYVITDQLQRLVVGSVPSSSLPAVHKLDAAVRKFFALESNQIVHMLLRVGEPKKTPKRARRLS